MNGTDKRYNSDIPDDVVENSVSPYRAKGGRISLEERVCTLDGETVGRRHYDKNGTLAIETPVRDGITHGMKYFWDDDDANGPYLHLSEPHENGLVNGTARQWAPDGTLMGTYTLVHGTGYDLWRNFDEHGHLYLAEVHAMKDGGPHGYEWWMCEDQRTVFLEVHWKDGKRHGIERHWVEDKLDPGYPKFHVNDAVVGEDAYIEKRKTDASLPEYRVEDDQNERSFPEEILKAMHSG
jgi:antitoxin component YwqK of YwqJK toxin-antitoxin module